MGGSRKSTYETSGYVDDALSEMNPEFFIFEIHTTQVVIRKEKYYGFRI